MILEPCKLKAGLEKQVCKIGCKGCYYEDKKLCPHDKCSTPEEEYIFVEKNSIIENKAEKEIKPTPTKKALKTLF